jgi:hypothetical protein
MEIRGYEDVTSKKEHVRCGVRKQTKCSETKLYSKIRHFGNDILMMNTAYKKSKKSVKKIGELLFEMYEERMKVILKNND